jgi:hypothetical protein
MIFGFLTAFGSLGHGARPMLHDPKSDLPPGDWQEKIKRLIF